MRRPEFVDARAIPEGLCCSICSDTLFEPMRTPRHHVFCRACIESWLQREKTCPLDKKPLIARDLASDRFVGNILDDYRVRCGDDCPWEGNFGEYDAHSKVCATQGAGQQACRFKSHGCRFSSANDVAVHESTCPYAWVRCR
jgi:hypothetical protein